MGAIDTLPSNVRKEVKLAIEDVFDKYRRYKRMSFKDRQTSITASYEDRPSAPTNVVSNPTAKIAIHNVDEPARRKVYCELIEAAVAELDEEEQFLIKERYMKSSRIHDLKVYAFKFDPPISWNTYDYIRNRAMVMLALMLEIEIEGLEQLY